MNSLIISFEKTEDGYLASTIYGGKYEVAYGENAHDALFALVEQLEDAVRTEERR